MSLSALAKSADLVQGQPGDFWKSNGRGAYALSDFV
jgi:hypothetical protein